MDDELDNKDEEYKEWTKVQLAKNASEHFALNNLMIYNL